MFYNPSLLRKLSPTWEVLVARAQLCVEHVEHIKRLSRATCRVPRGTKGQLSCLVRQSRNPISFSFILSAEPLTDEGGEETGVPGENDDELEKMTHSKSPKIQAPTET